MMKMKRVPTNRKRRKTTDSVYVLPYYLPIEIITKILIKLPVKTLVKFRCVCRSWLALISDPIFVQNHLRASTQDKGYAHHRLIMSSHLRLEVKSCSLPSVLHEECYPSTHDHYYPLKHWPDSVLIVGSVNGLVCIASEEEGSVFLWNPSIRKSKRLPDCGLGLKERLGRDIVYGFGYDEASSDYKVIRIKSTEVNIYGLKRDSWRKIGIFPKGFPMDTKCTFVSGSLHWAPTGENEWEALFHNYWNSDNPIVSFDLSKETYSEISQPCYEKDATESYLGVLGDSLLCILRDYFYEQAEVWVMNEYGKVESWSKLFSIQYCIRHQGYLYDVPLCISFTKTEVLLMLGKQRLVLYNMDNHTFRPTNIRGCLPEYQYKVYTYIESLVSPYPDS
ncbi:F-box/kelch-repeat protein At3g23880-like [Impatiens glandulifera]|uniref:F-box/kelch-repeat protein At3g23880-like n=1 Tax=Impatiens glandulifera TaxID=253017 RepID=UPI001FB0D726|nr:F-box/kelch-repeat protein At3g23880-like [Impatiens glandulifera]